jgi:hypothetical protein
MSDIVMERASLVDLRVDRIVVTKPTGCLPITVNSMLLAINFLDDAFSTTLVSYNGEAD